MIRFRRQSNFWRPHWFLPRVDRFQERDFGGRIALVAEINVGGSKLVTYNLHLESRAHDELRVSQMDEVLSDSAGYGPQCMLVVAGHLNLDVSKHPAAMTWARAGFRDALAATPSPTTLPRRLFEPGPRLSEKAWIAAAPVSAFKMLVILTRGAPPAPLLCSPDAPCRLFSWAFIHGLSSPANSPLRSRPILCYNH